MLYFLASMLIMLALLDRAIRVGRLESLMLETRFKLFALRDELRCAAIKGEVPQNRWFEYLDTSITKAIDALPRISVWEALALLYSYAGDKSVVQAQKELFEAFEEEENVGLGEIYGKYLLCIMTLLVQRHKTLKFTVVGTARMMGKMVNLKDRLAAIFTVAPETSTLLEHSAQQP